MIIDQPCTCLFIPPSDGLDGIHVFFIDRASGVGYVTIICYGQAWTAYFGAMSSKTIREFFCGCDVDYLVNKLIRTKETKAEQKYLARIVGAAQKALGPRKETLAEIFAAEDEEAQMPGGFQ